MDQCQQPTDWFEWFSVFTALGVGSFPWHSCPSILHSAARVRSDCDSKFAINSCLTRLGKKAGSPAPVAGFWPLLVMKIHVDVWDVTSSSSSASLRRFGVLCCWTTYKYLGIGDPCFLRRRFASVCNNGQSFSKEEEEEQNRQLAKSIMAWRHTHPTRATKPAYNGCLNKVDSGDLTSCERVFCFKGNKFCMRRNFGYKPCCLKTSEFRYMRSSVCFTAMKTWVAFEQKRSNLMDPRF